VLVAIGLTAVVLVFFAVDTLRNEPETFAAIVAIALLSAVLDFIWKRSAAAGRGFVEPSMVGGGSAVPPPAA
jgi:hypothetical protein